MDESDFPALHEAADAASKRAQTSFYVALATYLSCLVVTAVVSVIDCTEAWFYLLQGCVLLLSLSITVYLAYTKPQKAWYAARALAESVKTVSWRYMMRAEPYQDGEAKSHFLAGLKKIFDANKQASAAAIEMSGTCQITGRMNEIRSKSLQERKDIYVKQRIDDQLDWYRRKARLNNKQAKVWFGIMIGANAVALALAFSRVLFVDAVYWPTEIFVALAGAGMTWLQAKRFQELAASYALTTHEISFLKEAIPETASEDDFSRYVGDAENAFSREHTQWQARRDEE